jgi:hypothetical protein
LHDIVNYCITNHDYRHHKKQSNPLDKVFAKTRKTGEGTEPMPYVPPEVKERLKREISVQRLAEARGIQLKRSGKELIGLCPFHKLATFSAAV